MFTSLHLCVSRIILSIRCVLLILVSLWSNAFGKVVSSRIAAVPRLAKQLPEVWRTSLGDARLVLSGTLLSVWSRYDTGLLIVIISVLALIAIIDYLLLDRRSRKRVQSVLERRLALEGVISDLSVRLSNSPPERVDTEIAGGLERILATKCADHVAWSVFSAQGQGLQQTHFAHRPGEPQWPVSIREAAIPWCVDRLRRGEVVTIASPDQLPLDAESDRGYLKEHGVKSIALVPTVSDSEVKGALALVYRSASRAWPPGLVSQLRLVASILANALSEKHAQEARLESEERFRHFFESASIGMALEDLEGRLLFVNPALSSILGYTIEELQNMNCSEFADLEDEQEDWALFQKLTAGVIPAYQIEKRYRRKDGARIWGRLHVSLLRSSPAEHPRIVAMVADVTERKKAEEDLQGAKDELQHLAARLIHAQEEEKQRIARELHDDFGQRLSMVAMELDLMTQDQPIVPRSNSERLFSVLEQVNELATDVHGLSHRLHSSKLQHLGLAPALSELCRQFSGHGFKVTLEMEDGNAGIPPEIAMCIYRVAQEALNNAMKHSGAGQAIVQLSKRNQSLRMTVKDSGVGFDIKATSNGLGLASMRERLRALEGRLTVVSRPGDGTELMAEVPVEQWIPQAKAS